ncbi:rhodanese-like domain-containing protein [Halomarina ordinaria]|uniref:Rhodanese-like domain-containing protein n=1 Tax=Halomarina ordinaria TaxID=3033939 RepID=A0ABD5UD97_9EURY|nr:rhodanese-like domain-containing protein [Halomarina sp. PSRA2]
MDDEISVDELNALLEDGEDVRLVDIRSRAAFERGHIEGSENIPFAELPSHIEELDGADHIVTICPMGKSSIQAARLIKSYEGTSGATVESLREGLNGWEYGLVDGDSDGDGDEGSGHGEQRAQASATSEGPDAPF